jgi:NTE family protein
VSDEPFLRPDVLVLAAGGTVGEAWMTGVLAGLEEATGVDFRRMEAIVGTSAGSIVGASLVAGRSPRRPPGISHGADGHPEVAPSRRGGALRSLAANAARTAWAASAPLAGPALALGAPGGAVARSWLLARLPDEGRSLDRLRRQVDGWGARFDGRLSVVTVDRATGRRVVFGRPHSPRATVGEAVAASCAVPWIFGPQRIGDRLYVDGGVWSATNLDTAPAGRDTEVLCLSVAASLPLALTSPFNLLRAAARSGEAVETLALRRRGANVRVIGPEAEAAEAVGANLMDERRAAGALAAGFRQGLRAGAR